MAAYRGRSTWSLDEGYACGFKHRIRVFRREPCRSIAGAKAVHCSIRLVWVWPPLFSRPLLETTQRPLAVADLARTRRISPAHGIRCHLRNSAALAERPDALMNRGAIRLTIGWSDLER